ncbi:MAG: hypothetical protein ACRECX_03315 [Methyloceanibacter sp.]|uniref:hypothetical protein n=1 Tax=Methyloceanibacter sp. TaxID=1965321 RepID=UPI003D6D459F
MEPKEKFDALMQIANFAVARCDGRRQYEWKLTFGVWALLSATLIYVKADAFPLVFGFAVLVLYGAWLQAILKRNQNDTVIAWHSLRKANSDLKLGLDLKQPSFIKPLEGWRNYFGFFVNWSMGLQFWFTAGLIALFYSLKVNEPTWFCATNMTIDRGI